MVEAPGGVNYSTTYLYDTLGNLARVTQGTQNRFFLYDSLSRLLRAKNPEQNVNAAIALTDPLTGNSQWALKYVYDGNGNLTSRVDARGVTAKNGFAMTYDAAGNQTNDATGTRWYDGENRMKQAQQGAANSYYVYDADGRCVRRIVGGVETWMIHGLGGELLAEYPANGAVGSPQKEYGDRDGQLLIVAQTAPFEIRWLVADHLGSPRITVRGTGADGGSLASVTRHDYLPFGEELISGVGIRGSGYSYEPPADGVRQKFDAYERDSETGLDFVQSRYYSPVQGRFTSVDPLNPVIDYTSDRAFYKYIVQPQNWNGYAFNLNNPVKYVDRDGRHPILIGALIGAAVGAGIELAKQAYTMQPGQEIDWGKVAGAGAKGAIVGAVAGATGGLSLAPYVFAAAGANVVGGVAGRATEIVTNNAILDWNPEALEDLDDYALDTDSIMVDGIAGTAGGLAGKFAESQAIKQAANRYLSSSTYNRAVQTLRNIGGKSEKKIGNATQTVQSGVNNFFWWVDQARDKVRSGTTAGVTAAGKKRHKDVDCSDTGNRCSTDVTLK